MRKQQLQTHHLHLVVVHGRLEGDRGPRRPPRVLAIRPLGFNEVRAALPPAATPLLHLKRLVALGHRRRRAKSRTIQWTRASRAEVHQILRQRPECLVAVQRLQRFFRMQTTVVWIPSTRRQHPQQPRQLPQLASRFSRSRRLDAGCFPIPALPHSPTDASSSPSRASRLRKLMQRPLKTPLNRKSPRGLQTRPGRDSSQRLEPLTFQEGDRMSRRSLTPSTPIWARTRSPPPHPLVTRILLEPLSDISALKNSFLSGVRTPIRVI